MRGIFPLKNNLFSRTASREVIGLCVFSRKRIAQNVRSITETENPAPPTCARNELEAMGRAPDWRGQSAVCTTVQDSKQGECRGERADICASFHAFGKKIWRALRG
jgi:hypothetical protein